MKDGFIKVAAASPVLKVADVSANAEILLSCIHDAGKKGVKILAFPELSLTGNCLYKLIGHSVILEGAKSALAKLVKGTSGIDMLIFVGVPVSVGARVFNCAAAIYNGSILAFIPKEDVSGTVFSQAGNTALTVFVGEFSAPLVSDALFTSTSVSGLKLAVELGNDSDLIVPPSYFHAEAGATLVVRMAGFAETVTSTAEAELDVRFTSRHLKCGMLLAAPGKGESTTDRVYSGLCLVAENGEILASSEQENSFACSEIDVDHMLNLRRAAGGFDLAAEDYEEFFFGGEISETAISRTYLMHPHLPKTSEELPAYCERMLDIQVSGLVKRMEYAHLDHCVVGISGGVDSTLAVMVSAMAVKKMGLPSENVVACTLPCFGTSSRTKSNAIIVAEQIGAEVRVIDIGKSVYQHFDDIGHAHDDYSIAFENAQARERTQVLMDIANKVNGLDVGTEDLSEFIDGWCTYNGDHTSMYDVNMGLTKTQVRANVRYIADTTEDRVLKAALYDVLECPVTPELLPIHDDQIEQKSEEAVGSYSLQDFFTHKMLICGFTPSKTFRLAKIAYRNEFTDEELIRWLTSYCKRLFSQQFKRSCLMDGPAVEAFTVSPRVGFLIPSDAENAMFLQDLESLNEL
jgi:NAD+ synthase (glutamine-hydrolysing)